MSNRAHRKTVFQTSWLEDERFKNWLKAGRKPSEETCVFCLNAVISVEKIGVSALLSHSQGKKHKEREKQQSPLSRLFFQLSSQHSKENKFGEHSNVKKLDAMLIPVSVSLAEIRWTLKVVPSSFSLRSCLNLNVLFQEMFSDSKIAESFQLSKTKCGCFWCSNTPCQMCHCSAVGRNGVPCRQIP